MTVEETVTTTGDRVDDSRLGEPDRGPASLFGSDVLLDPTGRGSDERRLDGPSGTRYRPDRLRFGDLHWEFELGGHKWTLSQLIGLGVAIACSFFVFMQLRPDLLFADTTPAGGDMGAHVWGPAFLRDHLLPEWRLTGWTPDWYAGFPAYHFYMVVPSLAIVAVNGGLEPLIAIPLGIALVAAVTRGTRGRRYRTQSIIAAVVVALLLISTPYGIAFKLVSVTGLVGFPLSAWAMGRLARSREPVPAFLALGATVFLFDTNFTIYGGNIASTLAGEFAFSISLCLALLAIGLVIRGMDTGRGRVAAAIVIALVSLTHIIPLFFTIVALVVVIALDDSIPRMWPVATGLALALVPTALADEVPVAVLALAIVAVLVVFGAVALAEPTVRQRMTWLAVTGPAAALLSAFWLLPFYAREPYFNDMGWERLDDVTPAMLTVPMRISLPIAALGVVLVVGLRQRLGVLFATTSLISAAAVANLGEGPLWNARLLPFFYLSTYLLVAVVGAVVVQIVGSAVSEDFRRSDQRIVAASSAIALVCGLVGIAIPLRALPAAQIGEDGVYHWLVFTSHDKSFLPGWTAWNYSGYERKNSYREYREVVATMAGVGQELGCGRAMWEYSPGLDRYGTPMALMLLPHWTDGCIGSMEGLYFESSATTPFHFLNQSILSAEPSRAQRDLPYQGFNIDRGISELQVMGVRYYMAQSDEAIAAARANPELVEVAEAQPYVIFEVPGVDLVEALTVEPVVVSGRHEADVGDLATKFDVGWVGQAVTYFNDPDAYESMPAEDGPVDWKRVESLTPADGEPITPATVSGVTAGTSDISFEVDRIGTPVLVKTSYFPNWSADGAEGPWRIGPNLMVVVPTETTVRLEFGRTVVDWASILVTMAGFGALFGLNRMDRGTLRLRLGRFERTGAAEASPDADHSPGTGARRPAAALASRPLVGVELPVRDGLDGEPRDGRLAEFLPSGFDREWPESGADRRNGDEPLIGSSRHAGEAQPGAIHEVAESGNGGGAEPRRAKETDETNGADRPAGPGFSRPEPGMKATGANGGPKHRAAAEPGEGTAPEPGEGTAAEPGEGTAPEPEHSDPVSTSDHTADRDRPGGADPERPDSR